MRAVAKAIAIVGILGFVGFLTWFFNDPKMLWFLFLIIISDVV